LAGESKGWYGDGEGEGNEGVMCYCRGLKAFNPRLLKDPTHEP
jgi:hypothetical protein